MTTRTRRPSRRWALLLSAVLALTMLFGALSAISPPTASADTVTLQCGDDQFSGTYGPDSECADLAAYYASEGCTTSSDDAQSGGLDDLFVTCPGPVPPRPDDPNNPGDPDDPDDRPFVCDRAPQDPTWVYGSGAAGEQWRFVLGTGNNAGAIVVTLDNGTFTTDGGYGGFRETNSATGAERLVITSGTGINAGTGNCLHLEYTPGTTGASQVSGTQTRYGNYIANSSITITGKRAYDCGDGLVIGQDEVPTLVAWVQASTELTATEQTALEAQPCSFLAAFGDVEQDPEPEPASTEVAGPVAPPIGAYAAPARETPGACPLYAREVKLTVGQGFQLEILPGNEQARNIIRRILNYVWRQLGNEGPAPTQFAQGDVLLSLKLSLRVCTDGTEITAVDPPAGGFPGYEAIATAKGQAVGYKPPTGLLASSHGFIDTAGQTTFKSRAEVAFDYGLPGNVDLPVDIEFRAKKFTAEITVYKDGTWDYALSGGGALG